MKEEKKQILGHILACGIQMMWGAVRIHQGTAFTIFTGTGTLYKSGDSVSDVVDIIPAPAENCG